MSANVFKRGDVWHYRFQVAGRRVRRSTRLTSRRAAEQLAQREYDAAVLRANGGQPVALSDLQPGDVVTFYSDASHSGIYVGDGIVIHSSTSGVPVRVVPMNSAGPIHDARRY